jgi:hypothetical protein
VKTPDITCQTRGNVGVLLTEKFAVVTLYSYFPALFDQTIRIAWELVSNVNANVTMDLPEDVVNILIDFQKVLETIHLLQEITQM